MGTRGMIYIYDRKDGGGTHTPLLGIYNHNDSYPNNGRGVGLGLWLGEFLDGRVLVNGYGKDTPAKANNGMGCLTAELIARLNEPRQESFTASPYIGNGIHIVGGRGADFDIEWVYTIYQDCVYVDIPDGRVFGGGWGALIEFANRWKFPK